MSEEFVTFGPSPDDEDIEDYPELCDCIEFDDDGDEHDPRLRHPMGFPFLTSDNAIYKYLLEMKETGDEILEQFQISLIDDHYTERDELQVNSLYVLRDETVRAGDNNIFRAKDTFDSDDYTVKVQLVMNASQYDSQKAMQLLKDCVHTIKAYFEMSGFHDYVIVNKVVPTYVRAGRLAQFRMELYCYEVDILDDYEDHGFRRKPLLSTREHIVGDKPRNKRYHPAWMNPSK